VPLAATLCLCLRKPNRASAIAQAPIFIREYSSFISKGKTLMTEATPAPAVPLSATEDKQWGSFAHLGGILGFIPALVIWLIFKDRGPITAVESKEALNFQITVTIGHVAIFVVNTILSLVTFGLWGFVGWLLPVGLWVATIIFSILGFQKVNAGGSYRYPFAVRLIK
jgi:uncharacterized Tic20 family protein